MKRRDAYGKVYISSLVCVYIITKDNLNPKPINLQRRGHDNLQVPILNVLQDAQHLIGHQRVHQRRSHRFRRRIVGLCGCDAVLLVSDLLQVERVHSLALEHVVNQP